MLLSKIRNLLKGKKGQGLAEYGLVVAGVIVMSLAAVSLYGHKTADMWAVGASLLPGAHDDDFGPIVSGKIIATTRIGGVQQVDTTAVVAGTGNEIQLGAVSAGSLSIEP